MPHNLKLDRLVMEAALIRSGASSSLSDDGKQSICTMEESTDVCRIPKKFNDGRYKWPSLAEAYGYVTEGGELEDGGHDAMVDADACLTVFWYLVETNRVVLEPPLPRQEEGDGRKEGSMSGGSRMKDLAESLGMVDHSSFSSSTTNVNDMAESPGMVESSFSSSPTPAPTPAVSPAAPSSSRVETIVSFSAVGNTYKHRNTLRELGGMWNPTHKEWMFQGVDVMKEVLKLEGVVVVKHT